MPVPEAFDYAVPDGLELNVGDQVAVPLGPRQMRGVVRRVKDASGLNRPLKAVISKLGDPPLPERTVGFVE